MHRQTFWLAASLLTAGPTVLAQAPPVVTAPSPQTYALRYKFKPGDVNYYKLILDSNGTISGAPGGQTMPIKQHMEMYYHQTVSDVSAADGSATLITKFDNFSMTMNGQPVPGADAQMRQTITTTLSPTGKPLSVKLQGAAATAMGGMDLSKMANLQGAAQLPDNPVKVGDNWAGTADLSGTLGAQTSGVQVKLASTLSAVDRTGGKSVASIGQTTNATFDASSIPGAAAVKTAGKVSGNGTLKFDVDAGTVVSQTNTSNLNMTLTPKGDTAAGTGLSGPLKVQFQINTDVEHVDASAVPPSAPATATPAGFHVIGPRGSFIDDAGF